MNAKNKPITNQIIEDATGWDETGDFGDVQLYNGKLMVDTKNHRKGDVIPTAAFLITRSVAEFYNEQGEITETFELQLSLKTK